MAVSQEQLQSLRDMAQQIGQETIANGLGSPTAQATGSPSISTQDGPRELYNQLWEMRRQQAEAAKAESVEQRRERVRSNFLATAQEIQDQQRNRGSTSEESTTPTQAANATANKEESPGFFQRLWDTVKGGTKSGAASTIDAQRAVYEAGQRGRDARNEEEIKALEYSLAEARHAYDQLREQVAAGNKDFTEKDIESKADQIKQIENQIAIYKKVPEAQRGATHETSGIADEVQKNAQKDIERAKKNAGKVGGFMVDLGAAGTQFATEALLGRLVAPGLGVSGGTASKALLATRAFGGATQEARQAGAAIGQQVGYGAAVAATELLTEAMADGLAGAFGKGAADDVAEEVIHRLATSPAGQLALRTLYRTGGEGIEEVVSEVVNPALKAIYDEGEAAQESYGTSEGRKALAVDALYSGLIGSALGLTGTGVDIATGEDAKKSRFNNELTGMYEAAGEKPSVGESIRDRGLLEGLDNGTQATSAGDMSVAANVNEAMEALRGRTPDSTRAAQLSEMRNRFYELRSQQRGGTAQNTAQGQSQTPIIPRSAGTPRQQANRSIIADMLERGRVSNTQANAIVNDPKLADAFKEITGVELSGTAEEKRQQIRDAVRATAANRFDSEALARQAAEQAEAEEAERKRQEQANAELAAQETPAVETATPVSQETATESEPATTAEPENRFQATPEAIARAQNLPDDVRESLLAEFAAAQQDLQNNPELANDAGFLRRLNDIFTRANQAINEANATASAESAPAAEPTPSSAPAPAPAATSTGTEQSEQSSTDSRGYTGPLVETQDRVFETNLTEEEKQVPGLTAEEARHVQHHDAEVDARAKARIAAGAEQARAELLSAGSWSDEDTATAGYLIQADLDAADNAATEQERANIYKRLAELKKQWNKQGTEEGRALRQRRRFVAEDIVTTAAETLYGNDAERGGKALRKLNPQAKDNIMRTVRQYAQRFNDIQKNHPGDAASIIQLIKDVSVQRRTTGLFSNQNSRAVDFALEQVAQQEDGVDFLNDLLTTQIKSIASDYIKPGIIDQLKSFRFMAMLSNPATTITNLSANTTFGSIMESIASAPSAMMDSFMEHFTGQRTVPLETVKQAKTGWNGFRDAGLRSFLEVTLDAEAEQANYGYKEIKGSTFKMVGNPLERFLATMQKWQGYALKSTDQAAKGSARAKVSEGLNRLADRGRTNADNINALAEQEAKYRTLQTEGKVSNTLYTVRKAADDLFHFGNDKTGKYGLGTDIMPFAQVPANAVSASLEAHPVIGGAKAVADTLGVIHDAINGESVDPEKQARAARAWGRAANGAVVAAAFAALAARGHIRDKEDDDKNVQAQRRAEGQGTLQLNVSSALRDITGQGNEARDGDTYIDFSWIPQLNLLANFGVDLYNAYRDNGKITMSDIAGASWDSLADSIMEFPAVSKVSSLIQTWKYSDNEGWARLGELAATSAAETASSILVPNAVRAAAAGADPYERDVYNTDTYGQGIKNNLISGIPGLRQTLPERLDTFGNPVKNSGGLLHFIDKTVIPGNIEVDNRQSAESKAIEDLIRATGDTSLQPSRNAPSKLNIGGEDVELSAADKRLYKQKEGQLSQRYIGELMKDDIFKSLSPEDQAAAVKELYSAAKEQAKSAVADSLGKKNSPGAFQKLLSGVVNPGNGTDNDIPKLQSRNLAQYTSYNVAYKNAVKRGDTAAIDNLLMRFSRLNGNTQAVLAAKNPGENDGNGINNLLKYSQAGVSSKSYFAVKDAISDAQIDLDKSAKTGGDVRLWGLGSADIPASEKDKLVESGAFNLSSAAKNTYTILRDAGLSASEIATWFDNADYFSKGEGIEAKSDGSLNAYEVATAISKMDSLSEQEKSALYLEFKAALQEKGSPYDTWKEKTYTQTLGQSTNYGRTVGKPGSISSGNALFDYYKWRAENQK